MSQWRTIQAETPNLIIASQLPFPDALTPMSHTLYQVGLRVGILWLCAGAARIISTSATSLKKASAYVALRT